MDCLAPLGPVYQAGTLSGNPLAMAAGLAALEALRTGEVYAQLEALGAARGRPERGRHGRRAASDRQPDGLDVLRLLQGWTGESPRRRLAQRPGAVCAIFPRHARRRRLFRALPFEAGFLSAAHTEADIAQTVEAAAQVLKTLD